jgi:DNA-binding LacI/PurR family transcriptional regulator
VERRRGEQHAGRYLSQYLDHGAYCAVNPPRAITQSDIAKQLGIGQKTVSRVLNGDPQVSPKLREQVESAAQAMGYRLNRSARSIKTRRFDTAMFLQVAARSHHRVMPGLLDGIAAGLAESGRSLMIERLVVADGSDVVTPTRGLDDAMADGIVAYADTEPAPAVEAMIDAVGLPVVWINRRRDHDTVCPDDVGAVEAMVDRLAAAGHSRIAWFDRQLGYRPPEELHYSRADRLEGFQAAMARRQLEPLLMVPSYDPGELGIIPWAEAQLRDLKCTAVACYHLGEALDVLYAASRAGIRVPEDLSLIAVHHDSPFAGVRIDVAALPAEELGRRAALMLAQRIAGAPPQAALNVPCSIIPGGTVRPPRAE